MQRATKYVKYGKKGGVDRLIKGKPLLTWGLRWIFHQVACLSKLPFTQCRVFSEAECFATGDYICQIGTNGGVDRQIKTELVLSFSVDVDSRGKGDPSKTYS